MQHLPGRLIVLYLCFADRADVWNVCCGVYMCGGLFRGFHTINCFFHSSFYFLLGFGTVLLLLTSCAVFYPSHCIFFLSLSVNISDTGCAKWVWKKKFQSKKTVIHFLLFTSTKKKEVANASVCNKCCLFIITWTCQKGNVLQYHPARRHAARCLTDPWFNPEICLCVFSSMFSLHHVDCSGVHRFPPTC